MRILFMGTPDFAAASLKALLESTHDVCAVFSQPDKPKGRGHKLQPTPTKELAVQYAVPVHQPVTLRDAAVQRQIAELVPDLIIVVAYGKMLPKEVLEIPRLGCINVHGSLLPKYRGAAPIQWAVLNGEKKTGVTTMYMAEGMDTGDIILTAETEIGEDETSGELFDRLKELGAELLLTTVKQLDAGTAPRISQDDADATLAPMLKKEMAEINWSKSAGEIVNLVRGMNPWPCAFTKFESKKLKIFKVHMLKLKGTASQLFSENGQLAVYTGDGAVIIDELQPENGKRMSGKSFLLGHPLGKESYFG